MTKHVLVCRACGTAVLLDSVPTASPACQTCGNYGTLDICEGVVVPAYVEPAEVYPWTPYLDALVARQTVTAADLLAAA